MSDMFVEPDLLPKKQRPSFHDFAMTTIGGWIVAMPFVVLCWIAIAIWETYEFVTTTWRKLPWWGQIFAVVGGIVIYLLVWVAAMAGLVWALSPLPYAAAVAIMLVLVNSWLPRAVRNYRRNTPGGELAVFAVLGMNVVIILAATTHLRL